VAPIEQVAAISPRPLLLIHGTGDTHVSVANSEDLYAIAGDPKELRLLPGVEHARGMRDVPGEYSELVVGFFISYLDR
jgi:uncharacterized protein